MFTQRGFTLVELIVAISIMATIAVIAAPSFADMLAQQRLDRAASELASSLRVARAQAAVMRLPSAMCLNNKNNGTETTASGCASTNIPNYATLTTEQQNDAKNNRTFLVEVPKGVTITSSASVVVFQPTGVPAVARTISLCKSNVQRNVAVTLTGTVTNQKGAC